MNFISRIADRLILCPTTEPIDPEGKRREWIETAFGKIEAWIGTYPAEAAPRELELTVLKFPGTGGRAERAGVHPVEIWNRKAEIWTINPHGYGASTGPASVKKFPNLIESVANHLRAPKANRKLIVTGNSLGCVSALYFAKNFKVNGLLLRNPPPVREMIRTRPRYSAWNFGFSRFIADQVPEELDAISNASQCKAACLLIQSGRDRVVPVSYQDKICDAYRGPIEKFVIQGADHHEQVKEPQQQQYFDALNRFIVKTDEVPRCPR